MTTGREHPVLLQALRDATSEAHQRLDRGLAWLMSPELEVGAYRRLLSSYHPLYARLEAEVEPAIAPLWSLRRKACLLERDLRALGEAEDPVFAKAEPDVPEVTGVADAMGVLYVLEGACLGGLVLAPAVARALRLSPEHGCSFFHGLGPATAGRWREFLGLLASRPPAEHGRIVGAAQAAFSAFEDWLKRSECLR